MFACVTMFATAGTHAVIAHGFQKVGGIGRVRAGHIVTGGVTHQVQWIASALLLTAATRVETRCSRHIGVDFAHVVIQRKAIAATATTASLLGEAAHAVITASTHL